MRKLCYVCVLLALSGTAYGQEPICENGRCFVPGSSGWKVRQRVRTLFQPPPPPPVIAQAPTPPPPPAPVVYVQAPPPTPQTVYVQVKTRRPRFLQRLFKGRCR